MTFEEYTDVLPIIKSIVNNFPPPCRANVVRVTTFTLLQLKTPTITLYRRSVLHSVTIQDSLVDKSRNVQSLNELVSLF